MYRLRGKAAVTPPRYEHERGEAKNEVHDTKMHYSSMASRERDEKGSQREAKGAKWEPTGCQKGTEMEPKDTEMKKAPPKAPFAEQERKRWQKGCENYYNVCQKGAKMEPTPMPKAIKQKVNEKTGNETTHENHGH